MCVFVASSLIESAGMNLNGSETLPFTQCHQQQSTAISTAISHLWFYMIFYATTTKNIALISSKQMKVYQSCSILSCWYGHFWLNTLLCADVPTNSKERERDVPVSYNAINEMTCYVHPKYSYLRSELY